MNNKEEGKIPPNSFSDLEKICRTIFSPVNVNKKDTLRNNSFTTPAGKDEVSVNRLDYTIASFIKKISKLISNPDLDRNYYGFAIIDVKEIKDSESEIIYSPNEIITESETIKNIFHSDIKIGYIKEVGKQLPMRYAYKVESMVKKSRFYKDNNPNSEVWEDGDLI